MSARVAATSVLRNDPDIGEGVRMQSFVLFWLAVIDNPVAA
jgi:hypothetical protein